MKYSRLLCALAVLSLFGCKRYTAEDVLKHLSTEYNETFTLHEFSDASFHTTLTIEAETPAIPGAVITARVSDEGVYTDDYMGFVWREDMEQLAEESLDEAFGEENSSRVYIKIGGTTLQSAEDNKEGMQAYMAAGDARMILSIFIDEDVLTEDHDMISERVAEGLKNAGLNADGTIVICHHTAFSELTRADGDDIDMQSGKYASFCIYMIDETWQYTLCKWEI